MKSYLISNVIYNVIENRVYKFTYDEIKKQIKEKLLNIRLLDVSSVINSYSFNDSLKDALNYYIDLGTITKIGEYYVPSETCIYNHYDVNSDMLVYSYGYKKSGYFDIDLEKETLVDVDSCCAANKFNNNYIVLVGELLDEGLWEVSEVTFDEVNTLYHMLKEQGASREEIVQCVLNYYNAIKSDNKKFPNRYVITPHVKKLKR